MRKPHPRAYAAAALALGAPPGGIVYLDDLPWNVEGAGSPAFAIEVSYAEPGAAVTMAPGLRRSRPERYVERHAEGGRRLGRGRAVGVAIADVAGKARALFDARTDRQAIAPFTDADPTLTMADGYAVQAELIKLILDAGDTIVGYKVGLTSKPMQRLIGVDSPDYGPVLGSTVYRDGDVISLAGSSSPRSRPRSSSSSANPFAARASPSPMRTGRSPASPRRSRSSTPVRRLADQARGHRGGSCEQWCVAVSGRLVPLDGIDTRLIGMSLTRNGELIDTGAGEAALVDPMTVVAWLANTLGSVGLASSRSSRDDGRVARGRPDACR